MLNFKKISSISKKKPKHEEEFINDSKKVLAVWGSPNAGKTT